MREKRRSRNDPDMVDHLCHSKKQYSCDMHEGFMFENGISIGRMFVLHENPSSNNEILRRNFTKSSLTCEKTDRSTRSHRSKLSKKMHCKYIGDKLNSVQDNYFKKIL
mmetsp:Transcript_5860/g.12436  ORF Transcript_5860/g.12436 Transcript_5860/m.12436 type:complete len:108 (+) Transcript_5860:1011-1334(+)